MAHHMFQTAEIRWFFKGDIPKEVLDWFYDTDFEPDKQAQRTDYYMILPDNDSLGIKLREGRLEFKQRFGMSEEFIFDKSIGGCLEYWQKWSFELADYTAVINDIQTYPESWIGVVKDRSLQMFSISEDGKIFQSPTDVLSHNGCGWELTKLHIKGKNEKWWSIGFEALGNEDQFRNTLVMIADHILSTSKGILLDLSNSFGYPNWLQQNH